MENIENNFHFNAKVIFYFGIHNILWVNLQIMPITAGHGNVFPILLF